MAEFHLQNGSLQRVEARIQAHTRVAVLLRHAVIGQLSQLGSQLIILGEKRTAIAETTQIFGRKERGASHIADSASLAHGAVGEGNLRTDGLAGVFHHIQIVVSGHGHNTLHISTLAKQVHRQDNFGFGCNGGFQLFGVHHESVGIDIHQYGFQSEQHNDLECGHECERHGNHLIAGLEIQRHQRKLERIGAIGAGDHMFGVRKMSQSRLKLRNSRSAHKVRVVEHRPYSVIHLRLYLTVLTVQIHHSNLFHLIKSKAAKITIFIYTGERLG